MRRVTRFWPLNLPTAFHEDAVLPGELQTRFTIWPPSRSEQNAIWIRCPGDHANDTVPSVPSSLVSLLLS